MANKNKSRRDEQQLPQRSKRQSERPLLNSHLFPHANTKSVLSIDGGGIRGYSSLVILQALMEKIGEIERAHDPMATSSLYSSAHELPADATYATSASNATPPSEYWPCHYFDYIAGVGTGGIIALMLGRCRMSVREAMATYRDMCVSQQEPEDAQRFERQRTWPHRNPGRREHSAITTKLVPAWPSPNERGEDLESDPARCRTIVCGCDSKLQPLRSYPVPEPESQESSAPESHAITDVISNCMRANPPPPRSCTDAKYLYNNPSRTVLREVPSAPDPTKDPQSDGIDLLSVGGAVTEPVSAKFNDKLPYHMSKQRLRVHGELSTRPHRFKLGRYCRLDVLRHDFHDVGVYAWRPDDDHRLPPDTFRRIENATRVYLRGRNVVDAMDEFAAALVVKRRLTAESVRWERWALGLVYRCPVVGCGDWKERFEDCGEFGMHMREKHGVDIGERQYGSLKAMARTREGVVGAEEEGVISTEREGTGKAGKDVRGLVEDVLARKAEDWIRVHVRENRAVGWEA